MTPSAASPLGKLTRPAFRDIEKVWLPEINQAVVTRNFRPLVRHVEQEFEHARIGDSVGRAFRLAAPKVANAAAKIAPRAADEFVKAWLSSGPWGKLLTGIVVAKKAGLLSPGSSPLRPMFVHEVAGRGTPGLPDKIKRAGRLAPLGGAAAAVGAAIAYDNLSPEQHVRRGPLITTGGPRKSPFLADLAKRITGRGDDTGPPTSRGQVPRGFRRRADGSIVRTAAPSRGSAVHLVPIEVKIEGKQVARAVARTVEDTRARR
jgi:hypothetical protein